MDKIESSETKQYKVVFPSVLNDHDTLFGGMAMQWMDEVAYITATRFTRMKMVTVSTGAIQFRTAIQSGTIAEIVGRVKKVGPIKIEIEVKIFVEEMYKESRKQAVDAVFTFAAVDKNNKACRMPF